MKIKILFATLITCSGLFFSSCMDEEAVNVSEDSMIGNENSEFEVNANSSFSSSYDALNQFAPLLSKVISERKDVREFLKAEALKCFDTNYDVLYYLA